MKHFRKNILVAAAFLLAVSAFAGPKKSAQANCELRLVSNAGAGEIFMSIFTHNEEECLAKSDKSIEAKFRDGSGQIIAKRGGAGPQP